MVFDAVCTFIGWTGQHDADIGRKIASGWVEM
jgi:hypothetical protein